MSDQPKTEAPKRRRAKRPDYQSKFLAAYERTCSITEAARAAGIKVRTGYDFARTHHELFENAQQAVLDDLAGAAKANAVVALATLRELSESSVAAAAPGASVKRSAAASLISAYESLSKLLEVGQRLDQLEAAVAAKTSKADPAPRPRSTSGTGGSLLAFPKAVTDPLS
jgi:molybdenum-dependent DNA-binding transcriptional regulator ModE